MLKNFPRWVDAKGIYYGWIVLFVGTLGIAASIPGQTMGVSVYTDNLLNALGLDRSQISLAYLIGTLSSGLFLPFVGRVLDQRGSRFVAVSASVSLAFFVFLMSKSALISDYFAQQFSLQKMHVSFVVITLIYFGVRQFGQGQLTLSSRTMIGLWFERRRGLAFGISGLVVSFAFGIAPWLLIRLSNRFGSENSLEILSVLLLFAGLVFFLLFRSSPESCGLELEGQEDKKSEQELVVSKTKSEAIRTFVFWVFNLGLLSQALLITGVTFHMDRIAAINLLERTEAFGVFLPVAILGTLVNFIAGYFSEKIHIKYWLLVMQLGLGLGLFSLGYFNSPWGYAFTAIGFGVSGGLFSQLSGTAWPKLFGRQHLGAISGFSMAWIVVGSALGPLILSFGTSDTESLKTVLQMSVLFPVLIGVAALFVKTRVVKTPVGKTLKDADFENTEFVDA